VCRTDLDLGRVLPRLLGAGEDKSEICEGFGCRVTIVSASERNLARDFVFLSMVDMMLMDDLALRSSGGEFECKDESVTVELVDSAVE
jgi:hypothetical protein